MIEWSEQHLMIRDMVRRFIDAEVRPKIQEIEFGDVPPYDVLRKLLRTFGIDEMAKAKFAKAKARAEAGQEPRESDEERGESADAMAMRMIPTRADPTRGGDAGHGARAAPMPRARVRFWRAHSESMGAAPK